MLAVEMNHARFKIGHAGGGEGHLLRLGLKPAEDVELKRRFDLLRCDSRTEKVLEAHVTRLGDVLDAELGDVFGHTDIAIIEAALEAGIEEQLAQVCSYGVLLDQEASRRHDAALVTSHDSSVVGDAFGHYRGGQPSRHWHGGALVANEPPVAIPAGRAGQLAVVVDPFH
jgi:hypothetical protein